MNHPCVRRTDRRTVGRNCDSIMRAYSIRCRAQKCVYSQSFAPDPTAGAITALPDTLGRLQGRDRKRKKRVKDGREGGKEKQRREVANPLAKVWLRVC